MNTTMSSTHTDLTYEQVEDLWRHPYELTPLEYELVKYILNNELYDDNGNSIEDLEQRIAAYESDTCRLEKEIAHMAAVIDEQCSWIDKISTLLQATKKELDLCKEANNG